MSKKYLLVALLIVIIGAAGAFYSSGKNLTGDFSSADSGSGSTTTESSTGATTETTTTSTTSTATAPTYKLYMPGYGKAVSYRVAQNDFSVAIFGLRNNGTDDVQVTSVTVQLTGTGDGLLNGSGTGITANYTDIKIVDSTGATVMTTPGISTTGSDTVQNLTFTGTLNLTGAVIKKLYITADAANVSTLIGDTLVAYIDPNNTVATLTSSGAAMSVATGEISPAQYWGKTDTCR